MLASSTIPGEKLHLAIRGSRTGEFYLVIEIWGCTWSSFKILRRLDGSEGVIELSLGLFNEGWCWGWMWGHS